MINLSCAIPITEPDPESAVLQWFTLLGELCAASDYDTAESIFADDVVSFGTRADIVTGLDNLRCNQWEGIWGNIAEFKVATESEDHNPFHRPGRATVTLERRDGTWLATHTHFSLNPGTPSKTYGRG